MSFDGSEFFVESRRLLGLALDDVGKVLDLFVVRNEVVLGNVLNLVTYGSRVSLAQLLPVVMRKFLLLLNQFLVFFFQLTHLILVYDQFFSESGFLSDNLRIQVIKLLFFRLYQLFVLHF